MSKSTSGKSGSGSGGGGGWEGWHAASYPNRVNKRTGRLSFSALDQIGGLALLTFAAVFAVIHPVLQVSVRSALPLVAVLAALAIVARAAMVSRTSRATSN